MNHARGTETIAPASASCPRDGLAVGFFAFTIAPVLFAPAFGDLFFFFLPGRVDVKSDPDQSVREQAEVRRFEPLD
jgi:hypothetical protein